MSRSRKNIPIHPIYCCRSQKRWKRMYNSKLRSRVSNICRKIVNGDISPYEAQFPNVKEVSDIWTSPSDGKMLMDRPFWGDEENDYKRWIK